MERRRSNRKIVSIKAELISGDTSCSAFIENINEDGVYIVTRPERTGIDFTPGKTFEVRFQIPSSKTINLRCKLIWAYKTPPHGLTNSIGMEIIDPPAEYKKFFNAL